MKYSFTMKKGSSGQEVRRLQHTLGIADDGIFGSQTERTVEAYQKNKDLQVDGIAGAKTLSLLGIPVHLGVDVSTWNGDIEWDNVVKSGVKFAYVKLTEGRTYISRRKAQLKAARCTGLAVGGYHFGRPDTDSGENDAIAEAHHFLEVYEPGPNDMRPVLDMEKGMKTDDSYNAAWASKYCDTVEQELGVRPLVYTARWYIQSYFERAEPSLLNALGKEDLWWAEYSDEQHKPLMPWREWKLWQFTNRGDISGISGSVDLNWCAGGQFGTLFKSP
tara:strand:+ start:1291 stop:2115 length:825 start_codon:yes stop_codon:yes gene_type:complete